MENSNYLGTEKVGKLLLRFAIPCICSLIISCLYNIVDQIFVGNGVGYLGNAATGVVVIALPMEMYGDSPEAAKKSIARSDAARAAYYKNVSGQEWGNPHGYGLCIDASVGEDVAANLICDYVRRIAGERSGMK
ncbi:cytidylate kinase family protein [Lachnospiraceae bacterium 46-15]